MKNKKDKKALTRSCRVRPRKRSAQKEKGTDQSRPCARIFKSSPKKLLFEKTHQPWDR
jgi:hypothetical protein